MIANHKYFKKIKEKTISKRFSKYTKCEKPYSVFRGKGILHGRHFGEYTKY